MAFFFVVFFCLCPERDGEEQQEGICFVPRDARFVSLGQLKALNNIFTVNWQYQSQLFCSGWRDTQYLTGTLNINSVKCHTQSGARTVAF